MATKAKTPNGNPVNEMLHDLSQPLAAIMNYANGCLLRLRADPLDRAALEGALERVIAETLRAKDMIQRFRASSCEP